jgi:multidrug efflux system membrane fusion protein
MRATYITACIIGVLLVLWLGSGQLREKPAPPASNIAEQNRRVAVMREERAATKVRIQTIHASRQERIVSIRGRTQNKRSVMVRSQIDGLLVNRHVERGDVVSEGQLLCELSVEDRDAAVTEAKAVFDQARIEQEGSLKLARQGLQSETAIAQATARLASAAAEVERSQLNKSRLKITAPFDGVVEAVHLEQGQYVVPGSECITLVDLDPMLLIGNVTENELPYFSQGLQAKAILPTGRELVGHISFVAKTSDADTRTYPIEIHVPNENFEIPSGVTAQIKIPVESVLAQKISPALLVLDDTGMIGVRVVDAVNIVHMHHVEIIRDELDGIWVSGLPDVAQVIVVGQQSVVAGEKVLPTHAVLRLVSAEDSEASTL